jgi:hypothetical protein
LKYSVTESSGTVSVAIEKHFKGDLKFKIQTKDGSACAPADYEETSEVVSMTDGQTEHTFKVKVIDDAIWEPDKEFYIEI